MDTNNIVSFVESASLELIKLKNRLGASMWTEDKREVISYQDWFGNSCRNMGKAFSRYFYGNGAKSWLSTTCHMEFCDNSNRGIRREIRISKKSYLDIPLILEYLHINKEDSSTEQLIYNKQKLTLQQQEQVDPNYMLPLNQLQQQQENDTTDTIEQHHQSSSSRNIVPLIPGPTLLSRSTAVNYEAVHLRSKQRIRKALTTPILNCIEQNVAVSNAIRSEDVLIDIVHAASGNTKSNRSKKKDQRAQLAQQPIVQYYILYYI